MKVADAQTTDTFSPYLIAVGSTTVGGAIALATVANFIWPSSTLIAAIVGAVAGLLLAATGGRAEDN